MNECNKISTLIVVLLLTIFACGTRKETKFTFFDTHNNGSIKSIEFFSIPFQQYAETIFYTDFLKMVEAHKDENYCIILEKEKTEKISQILKNSCILSKKKEQCSTARMEILVSYENGGKLKYTLCWMDKGKISVGNELQFTFDTQIFNSLITTIDNTSIKMRIEEVVKVTNFYKDKGVIK